MTIKKSLLAVATASAVAIAGTGVANAEETSGSYNGSTVSSLEGSSDHIFGELTGLLGSSTGGEWGPDAAIESLGWIVAAGAAVTGSIAVLPALDKAVKDFQEWLGQYTGQDAGQDAE